MPKIELKSQAIVLPSHGVISAEYLKNYFFPVKRAQDTTVFEQYEAVNESA